MTDERVTPSQATHYVSLPDLDPDANGNYVYPPERVVQVCVVGDVTCLSICEYDEQGKKQTVTVLDDVSLNTQALLSAIVSQLDVGVADVAAVVHRFPGRLQVGAP